MNGAPTQRWRTITDQVLQIANSAPAKLKGRTVTHALQRGKLRQTSKFCREVFRAETAASGDRALSKMRHEPTPAVVSSVKEKTEAYKGIHKITSNQFDAGLRNHVPQVMSCVISHEGEFSEPLIKTMYGGNHYPLEALCSVPY